MNISDYKGTNSGRSTRDNWPKTVDSRGRFRDENCRATGGPRGSTGLYYNILSIRMRTQSAQKLASVRGGGAAYECCSRCIGTRRHVRNRCVRSVTPRRWRATTTFVRHRAVSRPSPTRYPVFCCFFSSPFRDLPTVAGTSPNL